LREDDAPLELRGARIDANATQAVANDWRQFCESGGAIDFSGSSGERISTTTMSRWGCTRVCTDTG
jgi:hypothetical protein